MPHRRILFVDDDPQVLSGLRRSLRSMRDRWTMDFVESGHAALEMLADHHVDVIVSDMRMPGMSGAQLLQKVAESHPNTMRLILTGQAEEEDMLVALKAAHQYLSKPCSASDLVQAVDRASDTLDLVTNDKLVRFINSLGTLPSFPSLYSELMRIIESEDPSLEAVGNVIDQDPAMSMKVLQVVNSSFFGLRTTVTDPRQATTLLGSETVAAMALTAHVFQSAQHLADAGIDLDALWLRAARLADHARTVARLEGEPKKSAHLSYTAGLLTAVGALILASADPTAYRAAAGGGALLDEATELETFGVSTGAAGGRLLSAWGLSPALIEAVGFYRHPSRLTPTPGFRPVAAVHIANSLDLATGELHLDRTYISALGLGDRIDVWAEALAERL